MATILPPNVPLVVPTKAPGGFGGAGQPTLYLMDHRWYRYFNEQNLLDLKGPIVTTSYIDFTEMVAPAANATNHARLFVQDNGAGKSQLCCRFATGAIQVITTEP